MAKKPGLYANIHAKKKRIAAGSGEKMRKKGETSYGKKKSVVYVMDGDRVKRVTFGDPNMRIKKNQKGNRKSFRSRHNCENPGSKTKARYWSCKAW